MNRIRFAVLLVLATLMSVIVLAPLAQAAPAAAPAGLNQTMLARATADECFQGIGVDSTPGPPCAQGQPKVNQTYVWGMFKIGRNLWFGTVSNMACVGSGTLFSSNTPFASGPIVCEYGQSERSRKLGTPAHVGDARPPRIYMYDTKQGRLTDFTPPDIRLLSTMGIRFTGGLNNVVLHGGPTLREDAVNLFAFQADTGAYLGSTTIGTYVNIRKAVVVNNVMYIGVDLRSGGGAVLRWRGNANSPFQFETVARLPGAGWELAAHEGRLFVTTAQDPKTGAVGALWMSPRIPGGGLTGAHATSWLHVWDARMYDPDPLLVNTYLGGALASFDGYLYWGSMHLPTQGQALFLGRYGSPSGQEATDAMYRGTNRAASIWRGRRFGETNQEMHLLYGEEELPVYTQGSGWSSQPNLFGTPPLYGDSGFGNPYVAYTWTMAVYKKTLYIGTVDWSNTAPPAMLAAIPTVNPLGADLWRFRSSKTAAAPEDLSGLGNPFSYGIRTMVADDALYLGTATAFNLDVDADDAMPEPGWQVIRLK